MTIADIKKTAETKMAKTIESFKSELQKIRTGRAHPGHPRPGARRLLRLDGARSARWPT